MIRIFLIPLLFFLCYPLSAETARKPHWVKHRPSGDEYYIGIGMARKASSGMEYAREARNYALRELSSEIKVTVASNSILSQFENNYQFREQFESKVYTSVEQTLEGYEVQTWENKKEYWVMLRLNKQQYALRRQQKLDKAKMLASGYFSEARRSVSKGDVVAALISYYKAVEALQDHVGEDLTDRSVDGTVNYATDIMSDLRSLYRNLEFKAASGTYQAAFSKLSTQPLVLNVRFFNDGQVFPVAGCPVRFEFSSGDGELSADAATGSDGMAKAFISRFISKRKLQTVIASLDVQSLLKNTGIESDLVKWFLPQAEIPMASFRIELQRSTAFFSAEEVVFGYKDDRLPFSNLVKSMLNDNYFSFTDNPDKAEYVVKMQLQFRKGEEKRGTGYAVFLVHADMFITIYDVVRQTEIFSESYTDVKGMLPGDYDKALREARDNLMQKVEYELLPRLDKLDI
jgi:hypothetical protein